MNMANWITVNAYLWAQWISLIDSKYLAIPQWRLEEAFKNPEKPGLNCITLNTVFNKGSKRGFRLVSLSLLCAILSTVTTQKPELPLLHKDKRLHKGTQIKVGKKVYLEWNSHNSHNPKHKRETYLCEGGNSAISSVLRQKGLLDKSRILYLHVKPVSKSKASCAATYTGNIIFLRNMFIDSRGTEYCIIQSSLHDSWKLSACLVRPVTSVSLRRKCMWNKKYSLNCKLKPNSYEHHFPLFSQKMFWLRSNDFDFLFRKLLFWLWPAHTHSHILLTLISFFTGMSTTSLTLAMGRRWWRVTLTSHSMTTSGTTWLCPGTPTMCIHWRSTHAPLLSTPMEPATWTSKVTAGHSLWSIFTENIITYFSVILDLSLKCCWTVAMETCQLKFI